jgi:hypothetical protein
MVKQLFAVPNGYASVLTLIVASSWVVDLTAHPTQFPTLARISGNQKWVTLMRHRG